MKERDKDDLKEEQDEQSTLTPAAGTGNKPAKVVGVLLIVAVIFALVAIVRGKPDDEKDKTAEVTSESSTSEEQEPEEESEETVTGSSGIMGSSEISSESIEAVSSSSEEIEETVSSSSSMVSAGTSSVTPEDSQQAEAQEGQPHINADGSNPESNSSSQTGTEEAGDAFDPDNDPYDAEAAHGEYLLCVQQMQGYIDSGHISVTTKNGDDFSNYGISDVAAFALDVSEANRKARYATTDPKYIEVVNENGTNYVDVYMDEFSVLRFTYAENPSYNKTYDVTNVQLPVEDLNAIDQDHLARTK